MSDGAVLILDADGVFMDERPYWYAALGTALIRGGLAAEVDGRWEELAVLAFGDLGLQRVAKIRGCNSNWDLAAALEAALGDPAVRRDVRRLLAMRDLRLALERLRVAADTIGEARSAGADASDDSPRDPLASAFGIDRNGSAYALMRDHYQRVLFGSAGIDWDIERTQLREPRGDVVAAFKACRGLGFELRVCTGRHRAEIDPPIEDLGLATFLPPDRVTSADEVDRAEEETGIRGLGKPHPFPAWCAALGFARAKNMVNGYRDVAPPARTVYVGDGWSDFATVRAARKAGIDFGYVHVRSPIVVADQLAAIEAAPFTLGGVDRLGELPPLLVEVPA